MSRLLACIFVVASACGLSEAASFQSAKPVWPAGREKEKNLTVGYRAGFDAPADGKATLRIAASTIYRAFINGAYLGHGPARGPHGYFRVDEWDLQDHLRPGRNVVAVEVAGYNVNSYAYLDQPSFLAAEVVGNGPVIASTAGEGVAFTGAILPERVQKVQRYSFQRAFSEVYRLTPGYDRWRGDESVKMQAVECPVLPLVDLIDRRIPCPRFDLRPAVWHVASGALEAGQKVEKFWKDRSLTGVGPKFGGYLESELEMIPSLDLQEITTKPGTRIDKPLRPDGRLIIEGKSYQLVDFGTNLTGFIGFKVKCEAPTDLYVTFDEILSHEDVDFKRLGCVNAILLRMPAGEFTFESMEPYTLRYLKFMVLDGKCGIGGDIHLRELVNPDVLEAGFACNDARLNRLFEAGRETFRQNAVDIFMDCPSRERAGWLCDSFFTSRVAKDLSGNTLVEKNFYENFLLPKVFPFLPEGMLPMCYPSDHNDGVYIPNWAMWFVVELEEYLSRSGDRELVDGLKPRVVRLIDLLRTYANSDGLLEKLPSWVFVEWSAANQFVQDVNYPSNMLWAGTLAAAGRMYGMDELKAEAEKVRETIRKQSFDGHFFVDNAVRKDGKLEVTRNRSETCQYYAFFFDVARPDTHAELWSVLTEEFGPKRVEQKKYLEIHPSNSFIGNMLRVEMLSRAGRSGQILDESIDYLLYMARGTGTLWENVKPAASCDHGFASHIVHTLYRDILGVRKVDALNKTVNIGLADVKLEWCEGRLPTPDGPVSMRWWKDGGRLHYRLGLPAGYRVEESHGGGLQVVREP